MSRTSAVIERKPNKQGKRQSHRNRLHQRPSLSRIFSKSQTVGLRGSLDDIQRHHQPAILPSLPPSTLGRSQKPNNIENHNMLLFPPKQQQQQEEQDKDQPQQEETVVTNKDHPQGAAESTAPSEHQHNNVINNVEQDDHIFGAIGNMFRSCCDPSTSEAVKRGLVESDDSSFYQQQGRLRSGNEPYSIDQDQHVNGTITTNHMPRVMRIGKRLLFLDLQNNNNDDDDDGDVNEQSNNNNDDDDTNNNEKKKKKKNWWDHFLGGNNHGADDETTLEHDDILRDREISSSSLTGLASGSDNDYSTDKALPSLSLSVDDTSVVMVERPGRRERIKRIVETPFYSLVVLMATIYCLREMGIAIHFDMETSNGPIDSLIEFDTIWKDHGTVLSVEVPLKSESSYSECSNRTHMPKFSAQADPVPATSTTSTTTTKTTTTEPPVPFFGADALVSDEQKQQEPLGLSLLQEGTVFGTDATFQPKESTAEDQGGKDEETGHAFQDQ